MRQTTIHFRNYFSINILYFKFDVSNLIITLKQSTFSGLSYTTSDTGTSLYFRKKAHSIKIITSTTQKMYQNGIFPSQFG